MPVVRRSSWGSTLAAEGAHPAMRVLDAGAEKYVEHTGQRRVADVAMEPRHRPGFDVVHPVAHHQVGALVEPLHEPRDVPEVVAQVGIAHHQILAAGRREASQVGASIATLRLGHDPSAGSRGELGAAVLRRVVDNQHLTGESVVGERLDCPFDAGGDVGLFVEARDHHRHGRAGGVSFDLEVALRRTARHRSRLSRIVRWFNPHTTTAETYREQVSSGRAHTRYRRKQMGPTPCQVPSR